MVFSGYAVNADIRNCGVENVNILGHWAAGGLIGWSHQSNISHCFTAGKITTNEGFYSGGGAGGLIGYSMESDISNSYSYSTLQGYFTAGGLVFFK